MNEQAAGGTSVAPSYRFRSSVATVLVGVFGALILLAVASVLWLSLKSARTGTTELIADKAMLVVRSVALGVREHLEPAQDQVERLAELTVRGVVDPSEQAFDAVLAAALSATPQVKQIVFLNPRLEAKMVVWAPDGQATFTVKDYSEKEQAHSIIRDLKRVRASSSWGEPFYSRVLEQRVLNVRMPVHRGGEFLGAYVAEVSLGELSDYIARFNSGFGEVPFVLTGDRRVLAHAELMRSGGVLGATKGLTTVSDLGDPVLAALGSGGDKVAPQVVRARIPGYEARHVSAHGREHVVVFERLYGIGAVPWIVGCHFPFEDFTVELRRLDRAGSAGLAILFATLLCAWFVAGILTQPVRRFAKAASDVQTLGPQTVTPLPPTRLAELDNARRSFNAMVEGLRDRETMRATFGKYVPRSLASAILQARGTLKPQTRLATTLFTDIIGFSTIAERVSPEALIALLNEYFSALMDPIEHYGGVVHQFQGDAILATFNLPVADPDHAANAVRTALAIQALVAARTFGEGVRLPTRVGINTGRIVGGTVGGAGRLGFTVHGDDVNVAARLEQLNKRYRTRILVSQATVELAGEDFTFMPVGEVTVRGRLEPVVVYRVGDANDRLEAGEETTA